MNLAFKRLLVGVYRRAGRVLYKPINSFLLNRAKKADYIPAAEDMAGKPVVLIMCYSFYGGGAERVACRLGNALSDSYRIIMLCRGKKGKTYPILPGIPILIIPRFTGSEETILNQQIQYTKWLKDLYNVKASISFLFGMNRINAGSKNGAAVICSERNNPAKREPERMEEIERIYETADHVVFQTSTVRNLFSDKVKAHSIIIPNPVEVACKKGESKHRVVNVARLDPQKNQRMLIHAFSRFYKTHPEYTLSIYGDGELQKSLAELIKELQLENSVFLEGNVQDVHNRIKDAEMFVLSSNFEGMSNALLECMMMGFPCISTACEGSTDIIRDGENGLLTEVGNEDALYEAMSRLADNPELRERLGQAAEIDAGKFEVQAVADKWKKLIEDVS